MKVPCTGALPVDTFSMPVAAGVNILADTAMQSLHAYTNTCIHTKALGVTPAGFRLRRSLYSQTELQNKQ